MVQWAELDEDVEGELIDGFLEEEEVPTVIHEAVVSFLNFALRLWIKPRGGLVLGSEAKIAVGLKRGRKPDLSVFVKASLPKGSDTLIRVAPWIVIEVLSPRPRDERRDRVEKISDYAQCRARYYWLVDPTFRTLEVYELDRLGRYVRVLSATKGVLKQIPGCRQLRLDLNELWREVEAAEATD